MSLTPMVKKYDVVIVGAGPAGCACAYMLRDSGLSVAVIDKATFPRDKICGDALSADVANQFGWMDMDLLKEFNAFTRKLSSNGIRFVSPNQKIIEIECSNDSRPGDGAYTAKRIDFDNFFFEQIKKIACIDIYQNQKLVNIKHQEDSIHLETHEIVFEAAMAIGADGAHSIVNKQLTDNKFEKNHYCIGLRQYYENVSGFHAENHIELHFYKDVLPGYFWIFPLPNNQANVGIGILSSQAIRKNINLKRTFEDIIRNHPNVKDRFTNAKPLEEPKGYGLPIGSKKRPISGDRFLLLGDAASLIDPFSGEGIANAIRSGRIAAQHIINTFDRKEFGANFNKEYDAAIYRKMWHELRLSRSLQKLLKYPLIFNFVANNALRNQSVHLLLNAMLNNIDLKKELTKPSFYLKLLFNTSRKTKSVSAK